MRVALTGTPGTGKTTAADRLGCGLAVIDLNAVIEAEGFVSGEDAERGTAIADMAAVDAWLEGRDDIVIESHLAHYFATDRVIVLRCRPDILLDRLLDRGESEASARENAESEALDVILQEAVARHGRDAVYEIETTDREPDAVAAAVDAAIAGEVEPSAGAVSYESFL